MRDRCAACFIVEPLVKKLPPFWVFATRGAVGMPENPKARQCPSLLESFWTGCLCRSPVPTSDAKLQDASTKSSTEPGWPGSISMSTLHRREMYCVVSSPHVSCLCFFLGAGADGSSWWYEQSRGYCQSNWASEPHMQPQSPLWSWSTVLLVGSPF